MNSKNNKINGILPSIALREKRRSEKILFLILAITVAAIGIYFGYTGQPNRKFENVILIGWDGVQKEHLYELLNEGSLPNLKKFINKGTIIDTYITTETETKPGWTEILTGYGPEITGVYDNNNYKPIPRGYTVFERLEEYFGKDNIATVFISGKDNNTGARGPHGICLNCLPRNPSTRRKIPNIVENLPEIEKNFLITKVPGEDMIFEQREGEPYYYTKNNLDLYLSNLGGASKVGSKAIECLEKYQEKRFFMFIHFEEPDEQGHRYGENSIEYSNALVSDDDWLGEIVSKLKELGLYDKTLIYLTTDHGFEKDGIEHRNEPYTFLATNDKIIKKEGDRKDITPTILRRYGFTLKDISPALEGVPLIDEK